MKVIIESTNGQEVSFTEGKRANDSEALAEIQIDTVIISSGRFNVIVDRDEFDKVAQAFHNTYTYESAD
jgi:hypothetical protein